MIKEKIVVGDGTKYPLNGILTLPDQVEYPVPAVVFIHGSGPSNMDEKVGKLTPFRDLANGLVNHGIASIRYDKRSFTYGRKLIKEKDITVKEETIDDAILATEILRRHPRIDSENIFILGHSMGAMLAPRIDAEGGNYRGLILLAGSLRKLEDIIIYQSKEMISHMNKALQWVAKKQVQKMQETFEGLYNMTDDEASSKKFAGGTTLYYFKEMGKHAVSDYLENLHKPILIMQGEKDFQVKVDIDFNAYKKLLKGKPDVTFKLYENLNHAFVPSVYGTIVKARKEYHVEQHIGADVIADIANWILTSLFSTPTY